MSRGPWDGPRHRGEPRRVARIAVLLVVVVLPALASPTLTRRARAAPPPGVAVATVELRVRATLRERPSSGGRVIERLPAGRRLPLLGRSDDGAWVHVRSGAHDGWLPGTQVEAAVGIALPGRAEDAGALAAVRHVRKERWIAESRYHDGGGPARVTVTAARAALLDRPRDGAARVAWARRGEALVVVRTSRDERFCLVEIGAGELAWVAAGDVGRPTAMPLAARVSPTATVGDDDEDRPRAPSSAVDRDGAIAAAATPDPAALGDAASATSATSAAPGSDPTATDEDLAVLASAAPPPRTRLFASAAGGVALLADAFRSNAHGRLARYEDDATALAVDAALDVEHLSGRALVTGLGLRYRFAGATSVVAASAAGDVPLGLARHDLRALAWLGYRAAPLGGLTVAAGAGATLRFDTIDQDARAPLPSSRLIALAVAVRLDAPALWRRLGARLEAGLLPVGAVGQTGRLGEGRSASPFGVEMAAALSARVTSALALLVGARYATLATHFDGAAERNPAITQADRDATELTFTVGLALTTR